MLHFWVQSSARSIVFTPSAAISLAAHLALGGAAFYGTLPSARADEKLDNRRVVYLAPPDRRPGRAHLEEHLQFVDVGVGVHADGPAAPDGVKRGVPEEDNTRMSSPGQDQLTQEAQTPIASNDSIYSILTVDEAHNFVSQDFSLVLKEGRKYKIATILATTDFSMMPKTLIHAVLSNAGTLVCLLR